MRHRRFRTLNQTLSHCLSRSPRTSLRKLHLPRTTLVRPRCRMFSTFEQAIPKREGGSRARMEGSVAAMRQCYPASMCAVRRLFWSKRKTKHPCRRCRPTLRRSGARTRMRRRRYARCAGRRGPRVGRDASPKAGLRRTRRLVRSVRKQIRGCRRRSVGACARSATACRR